MVYRWSEETPEDVPLAQLVILTKDQLHAMLDAAEGELKLHGFEPVPRTQRGESTPGIVYDLTDDMTFDLNDGASASLRRAHGDAARRLDRALLGQLA